MGNCELTIITENGGERSLFRSQGAFERQEGQERVRYSVDGDEGELAFSETRFKMFRRGSCGLEALFSEGEETEMLLLDGGAKGSMPVRTTRYRLKKDKTGREIELCYTLPDSNNIQTFSLKIQILFFSEEK